jgi:nucleoside-diphosphate-sugar epimerase
LTADGARVALLTGATSMVGRVLLDRLVADGCEVLATARTKQAVATVTEAGATPLYTDADNLGQWRSEVGHAEVIFHLATPRVTPPVHGPRVRRNARLARKGAQALADVAGRRPVVALSSGLVYGSSTNPIDDDAPSAPLAFARAAAAGEKALADTDLRVLRSGWVYGSGGLMSFVVPALRMRRYRIVGSGDNLWPLLSAEDAAEALLRLADADPGVYQASEHMDRPPTQNDVVDALCAGGLRKPDRIPGPMARAVLGGPLAGAMASSQWLPSERLRSLGWTPRSNWTVELPQLSSG